MIDQNEIHPQISPKIAVHPLIRGFNAIFGVRVANSPNMGLPADC